MNAGQQKPQTSKPSRKQTPIRKVESQNSENQNINSHKKHTTWVILVLIGIGILWVFSQKDFIFGNEYDRNQFDNIDWVNNPPCTPADLDRDWQEITDPRMLANSQRRRFQNQSTGAIINFDKGDATKSGEKAHDHWHRENPTKINKRNQYLDKYGNEVARNSPESHIRPNCN